MRIKTINNRIKNVDEISKDIKIYCFIVNDKNKFIDYDELMLCPFGKVIEAIVNKKLYSAYYREVIKTKTIKTKEITKVVNSNEPVSFAKKTLNDIYNEL